MITDGQASDVWKDTAARLKAWSDERAIIPFIINVGSTEETLNNYSCIPACNVSSARLSDALDWVKQSLEQIASAELGETVRLLPPLLADEQLI